MILVFSIKYHVNQQKVLRISEGHTQFHGDVTATAPRPSCRSSPFIKTWRVLLGVSVHFGSGEFPEKKRSRTHKKDLLNKFKPRKQHIFCTGNNKNCIYTCIPYIRKHVHVDKFIRVSISKKTILAEGDADGSSRSRRAGLVNRFGVQQSGMGNRPLKLTGWPRPDQKLNGKKCWCFFSVDKL